MKRLRAIVTVGLLAAGASGCGRLDPADKPSAARPPSVVGLDGAITSRDVLLSRTRVAPGPVRILIVNQTREPIRPRLVPTDDRSRTVTTRRPIEPGSVGTISTDVTAGQWQLRGPSQRADLRVAGTRPDADSDLLAP